MKIRMDDGTAEPVHLRDGLVAFGILFFTVVAWMML
jgi:hypothetical protein